MDNTNAVFTNRNLLDRTIEVKGRVLLASEVANNIYWGTPPEVMEGGMARILGRRLWSLARKVKDVEGVLYLVDDQRVEASDGEMIRSKMRKASRSIAYLLPAAKAINRYFDSHENLVPGEALGQRSTKLRSELIQVQEMMSVLLRDICVLAECIEEEYPEEENSAAADEEDGPTTRLSVPEFAGVLGVDESTLTDAVRDGEKIDGLRVDRWIRGNADHQWHFQVPNQILRDCGAEALIVDDPLDEGSL